MESEGSTTTSVRPGRSAASLGTLAAVGAYSMWGLFPFYWKRLASVEAWQILAHRVLWSALLTLALLALSGRLGALITLLRERRRFVAAATASVFITMNWGIYIWAINSGHIAESALGYYINPLFSIVFGAVFLREKLDRFTVAAVVIASIGVVTAALILGSPPWISLMLAGTFAGYGLVKKRAGLDPVMGLAAETLIALPFALAFIVFRHASGKGALGAGDDVATLLIVLSGAATAIPLLTFAYATNRITLQRLGFIQYISPSSQLLLAVFVYHEKLSPALFVAFGTVIAAVLIYAGTRGFHLKSKTSTPFQSSATGERM
ncbi:MAG: EamA family transporter RarD [Spirochaetota bacterium]